MAKPSVYELGSRPEIIMVFTDLDDVYFVPTESRLDIEEPNGTVITVSGTSFTQGSGYLSYIYNPPLIGWYNYEVWGKDGAGREIAKGSGFEVVATII